MKKTYATSMPDHIGAFLKASKCFAALGINITRVSYDKTVDSHMLFLDVEGTQEQIRKADEELEIYTSGTNNIFRYPELADNQKASEIINTFEEKQMLTELVQERLADEENTGIQVYIGNETPIQTMKDCSVVTATYELGEGMRGTIGIIGPKRMDYDKVVSTLKTITHQLDDLYKDRK